MADRSTYARAVAVERSENHDEAMVILSGDGERVIVRAVELLDGTPVRATPKTYKLADILSKEDAQALAKILDKLWKYDRGGFIEVSAPAEVLNQALGKKPAK